MKKNSNSSIQEDLQRTAQTVFPGRCNVLGRHSEKGVNGGRTYALMMHLELCWWETTKTSESVSLCIFHTAAFMGPATRGLNIKRRKTIKIGVSQRS